MKNSRIRILAESRDCGRGFDIYLDFSGQREYLMSHRQNTLLYHTLKDGMRLDELRRWRPNAPTRCWRRDCVTRHTRLEGMMRHLRNTVDQYVEARLAA